MRARSYLDTFAKNSFGGFFVTSITGVVCKDGIVIVGDKKVKAGEMTYYEDKIVSVEKYENLVVGAAGFLDIREKFLQDVKNLHILEKKDIIKRDPSRGFVGLTEDVANRLYQVYGSRYKAEGYDYESEAFEALVCHKPKLDTPFLYSVDAVGTSSKVNDYKVIGTGAEYGYLFLKPTYSKNSTMDDMAVIIAFTIFLIDKYKIDDSIGPDEAGKVQVWKFPNNSDPYEVKGKQLKEILEDSEGRLRKFSNFLIAGKTKS
jgi:20S proteasome alpha/beta subunit